MSFGTLLGRPKISLQSLEYEFRPINQSISNKGTFNAGIYLVRRRPDDRKCVEKRFREKDVANGRTEFEMFALRELGHENIIEYLHGFIDSTRYVPRASMFMELADLGTLSDLLKNHRKDSDWLEESAIWDLSMQLANAVAYLQYDIRDAASTNKRESRIQPHWIGVLHRDIKPSNIFLRSDFTSPFPRVLLGDFGHAIRTDNDDWKRRSLIGDSRWRPPEYLPYTYASEVWAVGACLQATCHLGQFYMQGDTHKVIGAGHRYSDYLSDAIYQSMDPDPTYRVHIRDFARYLGYNAADMLQHEQTGRVGSEGQRRSRRHPV